MSLERRDRGPGSRLPQPRRVVFRAGENALGIGREGYGGEPVCVSRERRDRVARATAFAADEAAYRFWPGWCRRRMGLLMFMVRFAWCSEGLGGRTPNL
jgi:hypothetical protein